MKKTTKKTTKKTVTTKTKTKPTTKDYIEASKLVQYHVYDCISPLAAFDKRYNFLCSEVAGMFRFNDLVKVPYR